MNSREEQVRENLITFVMKGQTIAKSSGIKWDDHSWRFGYDKNDLTGTKSIVFRGIPSAPKKRDGPFFTEPFNSFAKSCIAISSLEKDRASSSLNHYIGILKYLFAIEPHPALFTDSTFQEAFNLKLFRENLSIRSRYGVGALFERFANLVEEYHLSIEPISWRHGERRGYVFLKPDNIESMDDHNKRLPNDSIIQAIVDLYHEIPKTASIDRLTICIAVLLLITGLRVNELLTLPWDCLENHIPDRTDGKGPLLDEEGLPIVYTKIRQYLPEKSGEKITARRYLGRFGSAVIRAAVEEVQTICRPFHDIAKWMEANPGKAFLPFPKEKMFFTRKEAVAFFGVTHHRHFIMRNKIKEVIEPHSRNKLIPRSELERVILRDVRIGVVRSKPWPIHTHEILFVIGGSAVTPFGPAVNSVRPLTSSTFSGYLVGCSRGNRRRPGVFERYGKFDAQGNPHHITSHQFRHWLNNEMYLGGMSEVQISYQFGRYNRRSNSVYDHRNPIERAKALRDAAQKGEILGGFGMALKRMKVVDREEWIKSAYGNVHWGPLGGCADETIRRADAMPKECANCGGLIVVKGDHEGRGEAVRQLEFAEWWLAKAAEDAQDCNLDDDLQVLYYRHKAASLRRIIATHDDPNISDGTHVLMDFISGSVELLDGACHV